MRRAIVAVVSVVLLAGALAGTVAAEPDVTAAEACSETGTGTQVVLLVENEREVYSDAETLYPDTQVYVGFCDGTEPAADVEWALSDDSGLEDVTEDGRFYSAVVPDDRRSVTLGVDAIEDNTPDNEVTVTVQHGPTVDSRLANETIAFRNGTAGEYRTHERAYLSAVDRLNTSVTELNDSVAEIDSKSDFTDEQVTTMNRTLREMNQTRGETIENATELEKLLYERTRKDSLPSGSHAVVLEQVHERQQRVDRTTSETLVEYEETLSAVERDAQGTILRNLGGGLLVGLLIGAVSGAFVIRRLGESAQYFDDYGSGEYGTRQLFVLAGLGVALVLAGLGLGIASGLVGAIA